MTKVETHGPWITPTGTKNNHQETWMTTNGFGSWPKAIGRLSHASDSSRVPDAVVSATAGGPAKEAAVTGNGVDIAGATVAAVATAVAAMAAVMDGWL